MPYLNEIAGRALHDQAARAAKAEKIRPRWDELSPGTKQPWLERGAIAAQVIVAELIRQRLAKPEDVGR